MVTPSLPSWHWDADTRTLEVWQAGYPGLHVVTAEGPVAGMLWDCLSWIDAQTRLPEPDAEPPEPAEPEGPSRADLREWAYESRAVADAALRLANAIAWGADRIRCQMAEDALIAAVAASPTTERTPS